MVPWVGLQCVIVVLPRHANLLLTIQSQSSIKKNHSKLTIFTLADEDLFLCDAIICLNHITPAFQFHDIVYYRLVHQNIIENLHRKWNLAFCIMWPCKLGENRRSC